MILLILSLVAAETIAESSRLLPVVPGYKLTFPHDYGAHQDFRLEWWYITGWLETEDKKPLGFQVTFFVMRLAIIMTIQAALQRNI